MLSQTHTESGASSKELGSRRMCPTKGCMHVLKILPIMPLLFE